MVCTMLVHALTLALLPRFSELCFEDRKPGIYGAVLSIPLPLFFLFPQFELLYVSAGTVLFCIATHRLGVAGGAWRGAAAGLFAGVMILLNPASVCITAPWIAYLLWRRRIAFPARFAMCAALAALAALTPWTWRNYSLFHKLFFVRDNMGLELYIANNDMALGSFYLNELNGVHSKLHPNNSLEQAREVRRLGEVRYNDERMAIAREWIFSHPARFLSLTATRARMFWLPDLENRPSNSLSVWLVTLASGFGFLILALRRKPIFVFFAAVLLISPLMYYCVQADVRYRAPILWIALIGSGYLISCLTTRRPAER